MKRWLQVIAPGESVFSRLPTTMSKPSLSGRDQVGQVRQVVGVVGVGHDDDVAARFREAASVRRAVAAPRLLDNAGAGGRPPRASGPSSRCRRRAPRRAVRADSNQFRAFRTQLATVCSSFKQGRTTETSISPSDRGAVGDVVSARSGTIRFSRNSDSSWCCLILSSPHRRSERCYGHLVFQLPPVQRRGNQPGAGRKIAVSSQLNLDMMSSRSRAMVAQALQIAVRPGRA